MFHFRLWSLLVLLFLFAPLPGRGCDPTLLYLVAGIDPNHEFSLLILDIDSRLRAMVPPLKAAGIQGVQRDGLLAVVGLWMKVIERYSNKPPDLFKNQAEFMAAMDKISPLVGGLMNHFRAGDPLKLHDAIRDVEAALLDLFKGTHRFALFFGPKLRAAIRGEDPGRPTPAGLLGDLQSKANGMLAGLEPIGSGTSRVAPATLEKIKVESLAILGLLSNIQSQLPASAAFPLPEECTRKIIEFIARIEQHERKILYYQEWEKN